MMIVVYIGIACLVTYVFLLGFRQIQALQERVERLEAEKTETEALILSFMESMTDVVEKDVTTDSFKQEESSAIEADHVGTETSSSSAPIDVEDVLLHHSVRDAARMLGKGEGEMALYAKFRGK